MQKASSECISKLEDGFGRAKRIIDETDKGLEM